MDESMEALDLNKAPDFEEVEMHDTSCSPCPPLWDQEDFDKPANELDPEM
jgi:hypothetical protein